jgi:hypothetical protein
MNNHRCAVALLTLMPLCLAHSQESEPPSAFISANAGGFVSTRDDLEGTYGSGPALATGGAFGLPLAPRGFLYAKATYFAKTGSPVQGGTATLKEWVFNLGALQNFVVSKQINFGVSGGLAYTSFSEELKYADGTPPATHAGRGLLGLFVGADIEFRIAEGPFSAFAETGYNYAWPLFSSLTRNNGGLNLSAGIRYYFKDSRRR